MDHPTLVRSLVKPGQSIVEAMTGADAHIMHMVLGIGGEAGELIDAVKKHIIYGKPIDLENVKEELGDLEFYLEGLRQELGITRDEVLVGNINKLQVRYGKSVKYSDQAAIARADKLPESKTAWVTKTLYDQTPCPRKTVDGQCGGNMVRVFKTHASCAICGHSRPEFVGKE